MNLALFPITALLLLLSGVGLPAHPGDSRASAQALIKAILDTAGAASVPRPGTIQADRQWNKSTSVLFPGPGSQRAAIRQPAPVRFTPSRSGNRKAYRTRFGFVEGAYQPQGPPQLSA